MISERKRSGLARSVGAQTTRARFTPGDPGPVPEANVEPIPAIEEWVVPAEPAGPDLTGRNGRWPSRPVHRLRTLTTNALAALAGSRTLSRAIPFGLLVVLVGWMICSLWWPFGRDQGIFAWTGDMIVRGGVPYKDAWDIKGPAVYLHYALAQGFFGRNMWGIRLIDGLILAGALAAAAGFAGRLGGRMAGWWAPVFLGFWYAREGYWCVNQPDGWAAMLTMAAAALLIPARRYGWFRAILAGLLMGWVTLYKPPFGLLVPLVLGWLWWGPGPREPRRTRLLKSLAYLVSTGVPVIAVGVWMARAGGLESMVATVLEFNCSIYWSFGRLSLAQIAVRTGEGLWCRAPLLLAAGLGILYLLLTNRRRALLLGLWCLAAVALVCIQAKFLDYHWLILLAPFSVAAALGLAALPAWVMGPHTGLFGDRTRFPVLVGVVGLVLVGQPLLRLMHFQRIWLDRVRGVHSWDSYYAQGFNAGDFSFVAAKALADYLVPRTHKDDYVYIWGSEPMVYFLADRKCPTRFGWNFGLVWAYFLKPELWTRYKTELMDNLHARDPAYVVIANHDRNQVMPLTSLEFLRHFPEFQEFLNRYEQEDAIANFTIWRNKRIAAGGSPFIRADVAPVPAAPER